MNAVEEGMHRKAQRIERARWCEKRKENHGEGQEELMGPTGRQIAKENCDIHIEEKKNLDNCFVLSDVSPTRGGQTKQGCPGTIA